MSPETKYAIGVYLNKEREKKFWYNKAAFFDHHLHCFKSSTFMVKYLSVTSMQNYMKLPLYGSFEECMQKGFSKVYKEVTND